VDIKVYIFVYCGGRFLFLYKKTPVTSKTQFDEEISWVLEKTGVQNTFLEIFEHKTSIFTWKIQCILCHKNTPNVKVGNDFMEKTGYF
jgi:hypothetical protein